MTFYGPYLLSYCDHSCSILTLRTVHVYILSLPPSSFSPLFLSPSLHLSLPPSSPFRSTRGKNSEHFLQSLRDLLLTVCSMMSLECKENELVAPRAQAQSLQFLPQTFDLFLSVMSVKSLGYVLISLPVI